MAAIRRQAIIWTNDSQITDTYMRHSASMKFHQFVPSPSVFTHCRSVLWASFQIRKIAGAHAPGMPGTFPPSPQVSDPDMHHGTCVTHVPWCMPGLLTSGFLWNRRRGKTFPTFPAHAQPASLRIWQEAHSGKVPQKSSQLYPQKFWFHFMYSLNPNPPSTNYMAFRMLTCSFVSLCACICVLRYGEV